LIGKSIRFRGLGIKQGIEKRPNSQNGDIGVEFAGFYWQFEVQVGKTIQFFR